MFDGLYPGDLGNDEWRDRRTKSTAGLGAINLASEYEAAFGRQALDHLVTERIPDTRYLPGGLHKLLLELPWSDVFTTNYDTLLERTIVDERFYQLILSAEDLPGSAHPRIVKLHGSFPSHRPFVLTTEDYRTYPRRFAPFVNTVQQSLMENTLLLLGFSGDDPNFHYWTGWVRDELGPNAPRIYICGALNFTDPQKRLLEQRGVMPIDLGRYTGPKSEESGKSKQALALEWLLLSLHNGRPSSPLRWPQLSKASIPQPPHLPPLLTAHTEYVASAELIPDPKISLLQQAPRLLRAWSGERKSCPGWIVTPDESRNQIWEHTRYWLDYLIEHAPELPAELRLQVLYELNWRLERALVPLFLDWVKVIEQALDASYPQTATGARPSANEAWMDLAFAVTREAREDFDVERHERWQKRIRPLAEQRTEWLAHWHHEQCLHALWRLDQREIRSCLQQWNPPADLLVWQLRRASLLAEVGELNEAERISSDVLKRVRTGMQGGRQEIRLLSLEGWAMKLLGNIQHNSHGIGVDQTWERFRDRWLQLSAFRCDPWEERKSLELPLRSPRPPVSPSQETKFDYDTMVLSRRIISDSLTPTLPAFSLLRLYEEAGLPMRAGVVSLTSESLVNACIWVKPFAPLWSAATLVRIGTDNADKALRDSFDLVRIATLKDSEVKTMVNWLLPAIVGALEHLQVAPHGSTLSERILQNLVELCSRLSPRMSSEQLDQSFQLALRLHCRPNIRLHVALHKVCLPFFRRLFRAASDELLCSWLPRLLQLPILTQDEANQAVWKERTWPDPWNDLDGERLKDCVKLGSKDSEGQSLRIERLIRLVKFEQGASRDRACHRLDVLLQAGLLTPKLQREFGTAIWAQLNPETGLPRTGAYHLHEFLRLPAPNRRAATNAVRARLLKKPTLRWYSETNEVDGSKAGRIQNHGTKNPIVSIVLAASKQVPQKNRENRIDWTLDELKVLLDKAHAWWEADKLGLWMGNDAWELREAASDLVPFLGVVIMPRLPKEADEHWQKVEALLASLEKHSIPVAGCLPGKLIAWPEESAAVATNIRSLLQKGLPEGIRASAEAIYQWAVLRSARRVPAIPQDLLAEICRRVEIRQQPELHLVLLYLSKIVRDAPKALGDKRIERLCIGLGYLFEETNLSRYVNEMSWESFTSIPRDQLPFCRSRGALLGFELLRYLQNSSLSVPQILYRWKEACRTESLPEMREIWRLYERG